MLSSLRNIRSIPLLLISVVLLAVVTAVYSPVFQSDFTNWDDNEYITANPVVSRISLQHLKEILTTTYVKNWHPLTMFTYMVEGHFFGKNPLPYHITSLVLHLTNTLLVGYLLQLLIPVRQAWVVAGLFGLHPMHVESVAWVAERKDVLFAFFYLLALIQYVRFTKSGRAGNYVLTLIFFLLSGLSKVTAVSLPLIAVLFDIYHRRKITLQIVLEKIPMFAISVVLGSIVLGTHSDVILVRTRFEEVPGFLDRIFFTTYAGVFYLQKLFIPLNLSAVYPYPVKSAGALPMEYYLSPIVLSVLVSAWLMWWRRTSDQDIFFGGAFLILTIFLNLPFSVIGEAITADRYVYLPCVGFFLLFLKAVLSLQKRIPLVPFFQRIFVGMGIVYLIWLSVLTYQRCLVWQNSFSLWNDTIAKYPNVGFLYYNRGNAYFDDGRYPEAIDDFTVALNSSSVYLYKDIYANRATAFGKMKRYSEAVADLTVALTMRPHYQLYYNRAIAYMMSGDVQKALADTHEAIRLNPHFPDGYNMRGTLRLQTKDYAGAMVDFDQTTKLQPQRSFPYYARSRILFTQGKFPQALQEAERARQLGHAVEEEYMQLLKNAVSFQP